MAGRSGQGLVGQGSARFYMNDTDIHELFIERAAIIEFDGGLNRQQSTANAAREIRKLFGYMPESVKAECQRIQALDKKKQG